MKREKCTSNKRQKSQLAITARATVLYSNLEWGILHFSSIFFSPTNPFTIIERRGDTKTFFFFNLNIASCSDPSWMFLTVQNILSLLVFYRG